MLRENQFTLKGFTIWIICAIFFLYEFVLRTIIGTFQHPIMYDLELTTFQFSLLSTTVFIFIYASMQIPVGFIVDNIGLKKSLFIASLVCTVSAFGFAYSYNYSFAIFYRMLMGFGASFGFICLLISVHEWMPSKHNAVFIGLSQFIGTIGPMLAAGPLDTLYTSSNINWRIIFTALGIIGIMIFILVALFVENNQQTSGKYIVLARPEKVKSGVSKLFSNSAPWFIAAFSGCVYFAVEYLSENEGRSFIALKGFSLNTASYMLTIAWLGYAIGCPILGFISDIIKRRKTVMVFASMCSLLSILSIMFFTNKHFLFTAFFILGISSSGQTIGFAMSIESFQKRFIAIGLALNNAVIGMVIALNAPAIGKIIDRVSTPEAPPQLEHYYIAFSVLVAASLIALIVSLFFIKETYCKSKAEFTYLSTR